MHFLTIRDFRNKSAQIQRKLPIEKEMVLTSNGRPIAILSSISPETLEETLAIIRKSRAILAVDMIQSSSEKSGLSKMSLKEINTQIEAERKKRRAG